MIPASYSKCRLHCCLPVSEEGFIAFGFSNGRDVIRIQIPVSDADILIESIAGYLARTISHSDISSGSPSSDVSPAEQLNV